MKSLVKNKLLMMPLIIVLTVSAAMFFFAPSGIRGEPNKGLPFKAVKYCIPKVVQQVLQKIIKQSLAAAASAIPIIGAVVGPLIRAMPDSWIPVPCGCEKNIYDSGPSFMDVKDNPFDFLGSGISIPIIDYSPTQSTQKDLESKLTKELVPKWEEVQKQQAAMIKKGNPDGLDEFRDAYKKLYDGLVNANALALATNFEAEFSRRFPNMSARVESLTEVEKRTAGAWRQVMDAWMKGLHIVARNFDEEQEVRNVLAYTVLKGFNDSVYELGQTHVLQYLGAMAAQSNGIVDRTGTSWRGFMEMCVTCMELELENEEAAVRNITAIADDASKFKPSTGSYSLGF
ncbi:MAG: hypothetical protein K6E38_04725 [Fretibacterium sp.]|nr:hypothetical protein [Fretibacterium sp.]